MSIRRFRPGALAAALVATALLLTGCFLPQPRVTAEPGATEPGDSAPDVQDFEFASFEAEYLFGIDTDGVSTLTTTERLVAIFPEYDQNRGIARFLPTDRDSELTVVEVTDGAGVPMDYDLEREADGVTVVMAVPEGEFVHGEQTYVLRYEQRDVTDETDAGLEFFWDVNGPGWLQPFERVSARVVVGPALAGALTGVTGCWVQRTDTSETCELRGADGEYTASAERLDGGETLTLLLVFAPDTFAD